ncbi:hypothetical protein ACN27F_07335 [Solwaraspora sp. WMMB335]|uniref:hypothetical protein n=1 Tax=Solwaraspora sp. WMMB335 TaxID=3404118 RepID=UPI003B9428EA
MPPQPTRPATRTLPPATRTLRSAAAPPAVAPVAVDGRRHQRAPASLVAAAPLPVPPEPATISAGADALIVPHDDKLVVVERATTGEPTDTVTAYQLPQGAVRWRTSLQFVGDDGSATGYGYDLVAGHLLLNSYGSAVATRTTALDLTDGTVGWQADGWVWKVTASGAVVLWQPPTRDDRNLSWPAELATLRAVDVASGRQRWSRRIPAEHSVAGYSIGGRLQQVVETDPAGRVSVRDAGTGEVVGAGAAGRQRVRLWRAALRRGTERGSAGRRPGRRRPGVDPPRLVSRPRVRRQPAGGGHRRQWRPTGRCRAGR